MTGDRKMTKVGFIGLGIMGLPMAINLKNADVELMVNDLNHQAVKRGSHPRSGKERSYVI